jgi:hypothetical protein
MSRSEQALSVLRVGLPSFSPRSMAASSAILRVCVGGVEVANTLREVCEDG